MSWHGGTIRESNIMETTEEGSERFTWAGNGSRCQWQFTWAYIGSGCFGRLTRVCSESGYRGRCTPACSRLGCRLDCHGVLARHVRDPVDARDKDLFYVNRVAGSVGNG